MNAAPASPAPGSPRSPFPLFFLASGLVGFAAMIYEITFNNFLDVTFRIDPDVRGFLELPREAPGFLLVFVTALFFLVRERTIAAVACGIMAVGLTTLACFGTSWALMLTCLLVYSVGAHLLMPIRSSLAMGMATPETRGKRLGQTQAAGLAAGLLGCITVWLVTRWLPVDVAVGEVAEALGTTAATGATLGGTWGISKGFGLLYIAAALACLVAGGLFLRLKTQGQPTKRPPLVFRGYMWLFYVLALLFGARKQTFITFGPWVLIKIFGQSVGTIAILWMIGSLLGLVTQPLLGRMIDKYGERVILLVDSVLVMAVTMGYGWSDRLGAMGLWVAYVCFVSDHLLFGMEMARETYLSKIARRREDVAPSLALGVSVNHIASMTLPWFGGALWMAWGHAWVFMAAAGVGLLMGVFSLMIRIPPPETAGVPGGAAQRTETE